MANKLRVFYGSVIHVVYVTVQGYTVHCTVICEWDEYSIL